MALTHNPEPQLSTSEVRVLGYLYQKWPFATTVTKHSIPANGVAANADFVATLQSLSDNGLVTYEAFLIEASLGMRFIETMITPKGKAVLRAAEVNA